MIEEHLNSLQLLLENASDKNSYVETLVDTIKDDWEDIVKFTTSETDREYWTFYEVTRVSIRMETLLNLISNLMIESEDNNQKAINQLIELKRKESGDISDK